MRLAASRRFRTGPVETPMTIALGTWKPLLTEAAVVPADKRTITDVAR
jgi:hypothetical protein